MGVDRVLIVDPDEKRRSRTEQLLIDRGHRVALAGSSQQACELVESGNVGVALLRIPLDGYDGLQAFSAIHSLEQKLPIILTTASGSTDEAIRATSLGAFDYLLEPFAEEDVLETVRQALKAWRITAQPVQLYSEDDGYSIEDALVGRSRRMQEVYKAIGRVAGTDSTVLIRGESGTGKELVARAVYQHSRRSGRPFIVVNCVAIPETLLESELFGHEKGAFTGAVSRRLGKIERASGGTVFLDEIGDMPLAIQAKILRLLQDRSIERLGGQESVPVDVRILAATNRDLEEAISEGRFRSDLFYRLNVVPVVLPPLRERRNDVPLLCSYFCRRITGELGIHNPGIDQDACQMLATHDWPGNVRELGNAIEQLLILGHGRRIGVENVREFLEAGKGGIGHSFDDVERAVRGWVRQSVAFDRPDLLSAVVENVTRDTLAEVLNLTGGNRTRAAEILGITRPTLLAKMKKLGLR